jgi:hypothetical protein
MDSIKKFKYKIIKNFLSEKELDLFQQYCWIRLDEPWIEPRFFDDALAKHFHELKRNVVEKHTKLKLFKTYSYWKYFVYGDEVPQHVNGPNCEISVIVPIRQVKEWPIQIEKKLFTIDEGDAIVFLGNKLSQKRNVLKHESNAQIFFNYVDQDGSFTYHKNNQLEKDIPEWKRHVI